MPCPGESISLPRQPSSDVAHSRNGECVTAERFLLPDGVPILTMCIIPGLEKTFMSIPAPAVGTKSSHSPDDRKRRGRWKGNRGGETTHRDEGNTPGDGAAERGRLI
jgi:hypothetical protein